MPVDYTQLILSAEDVRIEDESFHFLENQFQWILQKEQYGDSYVSGAPQWVTWWALKSVGKKARSLADNSRGAMIDSGAIAPLNLTQNRIHYIETDAPSIARVRFTLITFAISKTRSSQRRPVQVAMQYGAIAALPSAISSESSYERLWRGYRPTSADRQKWGRPLTFIIKKGGREQRICV